MTAKKTRLSQGGAIFKKYLEPTEERRLFATVRRHGSLLARRDAAWMLLMRHSGARVGAVAQLTVNDAREALRSGYLHLRPEIQKGGRAHRLFLVKPAQSALRELLKIRREMGAAESLEGPLVMSRNHRALSVRSYQARLWFWCEEAGLDLAVSPHWLRHTLAKRVLRASTAADPRAVVQAVLGHADWRTTALYLRPDRLDVEEALREQAR